MSNDKVTELRAAAGVRSEDRVPYNSEADLRAAIRDVDELSQLSCERIAALATVAKAALKTLDRKGNGALIDALGGTLAEIVDVAADLENSVNVRAEDVGCNFRK